MEAKNNSAHSFTEGAEYVTEEQYGTVQATPDEEMYVKVLESFSEFMRKELRANYLKGDRDGKNGWLQAKDNKFWISELYYHVGKLQSALMTEDVERIIENCADIANLSLMTLDVKINLLQDTNEN